MKVVNGVIEGVRLYSHEPHIDVRGRFTRLFCAESMSQQGNEFSSCQINLSENPSRGVLRGFHYLEEQCGESKILTCLTGRIFDVVIDLRRNSPTYLQHESFLLSNGPGRNQLCVPAGCANAFLTLDDDTNVLYFHSAYYDARFERGIRYDDPAFSIIWPFKPLVISQKDLEFPKFSP